MRMNKFLQKSHDPDVLRFLFKVGLSGTIKVVNVTPGKKSPDQEVDSNTDS